MNTSDEILWTPERKAIRLLSDPAPHLVWLADHAGQAIYVNPRWSAFTGQSYERALGSGFLDIIHPEDRHASIAAFSSAMKHRLPYHTSHRIRRTDGRYQRVLATSHPLFAANGEYVGYVGANALADAPAVIEGKKPSLTYVLSERERAVLTWVAAGLTAEEIAGKLEIAARTVEFHIHSSARKLNSSNRVQTVAKAAVLGEIDLTKAICQ